MIDNCRKAYLGVAEEDDAVDTVADVAREILDGASDNGGTLGVTTSEDLGRRAVVGNTGDHVNSVADGLRSGTTGEEVVRESSRIVNTLHGEVAGISIVEAVLQVGSERGALFPWSVHTTSNWCTPMLTMFPDSLEARA